MFMKTLKDINEKLDLLTVELSIVKQSMGRSCKKGGGNTLNLVVEDSDHLRGPAALEEGKRIRDPRPLSQSHVCPKPGINTDGVEKSLNYNLIGPTDVEQRGNSPSPIDPCVNSFRTVELPPESAQYTIVLAGVPLLKPGKQESYIDLKNKTMFWLNKNRPLPIQASGEILMVRRVRWIGQRKKDIEGDCIIVNFRDCRVVNHVIGWGHHEPVVGITPLPLEYFYPYSDQNRSRKVVADKHRTYGGWEKSMAPWVEGNEWGLIHRRGRALCPTPCLELSNRFSALSRLDDCD